MIENIRLYWFRTFGLGLAWCCPYRVLRDDLVSTRSLVTVKCYAAVVMICFDIDVTRLCERSK